ncbi:MAG: hypothetical protein GXY44_12855 [Phycisphaerales bacterium]|nr:hypothetical protein [Phycisphaerales bacterium]
MFKVHRCSVCTRWSDGVPEAHEKAGNPPRHIPAFSKPTGNIYFFLRLAFFLAAFLTFFAAFFLAMASSPLLGGLDPV